MTDADCWIITDGAAGNTRQAQALAGALQRTCATLTLVPRAPWSWLAPRVTLGTPYALPRDARALLHAPWPPLLIGCGRDAALFTRYLRRRSGGSCRAVQILDPRIRTDRWDLVIAPQHDGLHGSNVLTPLGSLHPVDDAWLSRARDAFPQLAGLPAPRMGVLLGGPRRGVTMDAGFCRALLQAIRTRIAREGGSVLMTTSRRTPPAVAETVRAALASLPGLVWSGPHDGPNPYPGILAWADRLLVTADSVNMLSEACATGCAVHTLASPRLPPRLARFHAALRQHGLLHDADAEAPLKQPPLRETGRIADCVAQRLELVQR